MENNTSYGPGTYVVHGELDVPDPRKGGQRPKMSWKVVVNPDGSGEQYSEDGTHEYTYDVREEPSEILRSWDEVYGYPVEKIS